MPNPDRVCRFKGSLLGLTVGDSVGAPYEALFEDMIISYGGADEIVKHESGKLLQYTDDAQMMIGVAECLAEHGEIVAETLCNRFGTNYQKGRGYGQGVRPLLEAMAVGEYKPEMTTSVFEDGSYGNGAAMLVAPVGLMFPNDDAQLVEQVEASALVTHAHPLGIDGAIAVAKAVALASQVESFDRVTFFDTIAACVKTEEFQWQLTTARDLPAFSSVSFGNDIAAQRSCVTAIVCFADSPDDFLGVIARAIGVGGDVDTIAAMAGSVSGAFLGVDAIPQNLLDCLENDHQGRDYIAGLAEKLAVLNT